MTMLHWKFKFEHLCVSFTLGNACHYGSPWFRMQMQHLFTCAPICFRCSLFNSISCNTIHIFLLFSQLIKNTAVLKYVVWLQAMQFPTGDFLIARILFWLWLIPYFDCLGCFSKRKQTSLELDTSSIKPIFGTVQLHLRDLRKK